MLPCFLRSAPQLHFVRFISENVLQCGCRARDYKASKYNWVVKAMKLRTFSEKSAFHEEATTLKSMNEDGNLPVPAFVGTHVDPENGCAYLIME